MSANRLLRLSIVATAISALAACGGGGDGGSTSSSPVPVGSTPVTSPVSNAPVTDSPVTDSPIAQPPTVGRTSFTVNLSRVGFTNRDVLVTTGVKASTAATTGRATALRARRADLPVVQGQDLAFTNMVRSGLLSGLGTSLTTTDGSVVPCDLSTVDIKIGTIYTMNAATGDMIATITAPARIDLVTVADATTCVPAYEQHDYVVTGVGQVIMADQLRIAQIADVLPAHEAAFNTSDSAVLAYSDLMYRTLEITSTGASLVDLTSADAPILTVLGRMAYDGTYLIGQSAFIDGKFFVVDGGLIVYQRNSRRFGVINASPSKNYGLFIGADNKFYLSEDAAQDWNEFSGVHILDPEGLMAGTSNGRGARFTPPELPQDATFDNTNNVGYKADPVPAQIAGRVGDWIIGHNCQPWNMRTGRLTKILSQHASREPSYARVIDGKVLCTSSSKGEFVRHDVLTGADDLRIDLSTKGYMVGKFKMYADQAMVEVLDTATADRKYVNIDFKNRALTDLGVISGDSRKVVDLLPSGN